MREHKGFTLIELMIVVCIIGILAAMALPKYSALLRKAHESTTKENLAALRAAISIYSTDKEGNPPTDNLQSLVPKYIGSIPYKNTPTYHPKGKTVSAGLASSQTESTGDWFYFNNINDAQFGTVVVNCIHSDLRGSAWTSL